MPSEAPTTSRNHLEPTGRGRDSDLSSMSGFDILDSDRYSALTPLDQVYDTDKVTCPGCRFLGCGCLFYVTCPAAAWQLQATNVQSPGAAFAEYYKWSLLV